MDNGLVRAFLPTADVVADATPAPQSAVDVAIEKAARACFIKDGLKRTTMTAIAQAAGVSRPTLYARYANVEVLAAHLLTVELIGLMDDLQPTPRNVDELVAATVSVADAVRKNDFLRAIVTRDPQLLVTYQFERLGTSQVHIIGYLERVIEAIQERDRKPANAGDHRKLMRDGDARTMATFVLITVQTAALAAGAIKPIVPDAEVWREELAQLLKGYLYRAEGPVISQ